MWSSGEPCSKQKHHNTVYRHAFKFLLWTWWENCAGNKYSKFPFPALNNFRKLQLLMQTYGTTAWYRELLATWRTKRTRIDTPGEITAGQECLEFLGSLHLSPPSVWRSPIYWCSVTVVLCLQRCVNDCGSVSIVLQYKTVTHGHHIDIFVTLIW